MPLNYKNLISILQNIHQYIIIYKMLCLPSCFIDKGHSITNSDGISL